MKRNNHASVVRLTSLAILAALVVVLQTVASGIRIGPVPISLTLVPIVVGAILFGPGAGAGLGFVFGLVCLIAGVTGADKFTYLLWTASPFWLIVVCVGKAVLCGLCAGERAQKIMRRVMEDETLIDFQPYFAHYVLDALWKTGLFNPYGMKQIDRWKPMVDACDKGLQEGWIRPGGSYSFDHSHAWGGTPAYQLPCRIMGFEMLEPGFRRIALHPDAMGLDWAEVVMPTPFGPLTVALRDGGAAFYRGL